MRILTYNPLAANTVERLVDISDELKDWDIILLCGTQEWAGPEAVRKVMLPNHWCLRIGARKGKYITKACGLAILVHRRMDQNCLREIYTPPTSLQGRVAGVKLATSTMDLAIFPVYYAPVHTKRYDEIGARIGDWLETTTDRLGTRTFIVIAGDVNSDFGLHRSTDGIVQKTINSCLGTYAKTIENENGTAFRKMCQSSDLSIITTNYDTGPTYFGPRGGTSKVDHIALPAGATTLVQRCMVLHASGKRLQLI
eukprot:1374435-Pyramimonas_sp.AAC.1